MHHINAPSNISYRVYREAYRTETMLGRLTVIEIYGKQATSYENFCGSNLLFAKNLGVVVNQE